MISGPKRTKPFLNCVNFHKPLYTQTDTCTFHAISFANYEITSVVQFQTTD